MYNYIVMFDGKRQVVFISSYKIKNLFYLFKCNKHCCVSYYYTLHIY